MRYLQYISKMRVSILILFVFPFHGFSQDISGVWTGRLYNDTTKEYIPFELAINESNGKSSGFSHTTFISDNVKNVGVKEVKIKIKNDEILVEDEKFVYNNFPEPPPKGVKMYATLTLSYNDTTEVLKGTWKTNATRHYSPLTGSVFLERKKKNPENTVIVKKLEDLGLAKQLLFLPAPQNNIAINETREGGNRKQQEIESIAKVQKAKEDSVKKQQEIESIAKAQKAKEDSVKKQQELESIAKAQKAKEDSVKKQQEIESIAKAQKAKEDSIKKQQEIESIAKIQKAKEDSVKKQQELESIAKVQKAKEDSVKKQQELESIAKAQKAKEDSVKKQQELESIAKVQKAKEDSVKKQKELESLAKVQKAKEDSIKKQQEIESIAKVQKAKKDSIRKQQEEKEAIAKAAQLKALHAQQAKEELAKQRLAQEQLAKQQKATEELARQQQAKEALAKAQKTKEEQERQKRAQEELLQIQKANPTAAADLSKRKLETIRTVDIVQDSLVFSLYDNGSVDGDTVSVLINGKVVMPRVGLLEKAINKTIYITPDMGDSVSVVLYAENLGSIPPNTGLLVIREGTKIYEIRFSGDLNKNSKIILVRKKKT